MKYIKIRVTKEIEEIHTCPVTNEEYEQIENGDIMLEDVLWGCNEKNNKVREMNEHVSWEKLTVIEINKRLKWK